MALPSPVISVVMPCVILLAARLSTSTLYSDWPSMSMKPGAITSFDASMRRLAVASLSAPTATIRSPATQTSARNQGAPVPSTMRPPANSRSQLGGAAVTDTEARMAGSRRTLGVLTLIAISPVEHRDSRPADASPRVRLPSCDESAASLRRARHGAGRGAGPGARVDAGRAHPGRDRPPPVQARLLRRRGLLRHGQEGAVRVERREA